MRDELDDRIRPVIDGLDGPAEIIFVNDGSADRLLALLKSRPLFVVDELTGFDQG